MIKERFLSSCTLLEEIRKLKESSKEAIEGIEEFSLFKEYMHVEREVEIELKKILLHIHEQNISKQLVLVCGSVGDGKSHIISQLKHNYPSVLNTFDILNDATESNNPNKSYKEVLDEKLDQFSDDKIENSTHKRLIIAINLGTLSNFIEDDFYKEKYSKLRNFVMQNRIIEDEIGATFNVEQISYVNFSDFAIFELEDNGPKSNFIDTLLSKIVSSNDENPFYSSYRNKCVSNCDYSSHCPLKVNFELLFNKTIRKSITELVIEAIVKFKVITSTRLFLNFVYNILVPVDFEKTSDNNLLMNSFTHKSIHKIELKWLLPNLLFEHKSRSTLFNGLNQVDPTIDRLEIVDNVMIELNTLNNHKDTINKFFNDGDLAFLDNIIDYTRLSELDIDAMNELTKTYVRIARLLRSNLLPDRKLYIAFMYDLFNYNANNVLGLKDLYAHTKEAIYMWNGITDHQWINIDNMTNSKDFVLSQEFKIEPVLNNQLEIKIPNTIHKFSTEIKLSFRCYGNESTVHFYLDYDLYRLTDQVRRGYRLNKRDREDYIAFIDSLKCLINSGDKHKLIRISHKLADDSKEFILKKDIFGGYAFD